MAIDSIAPSVFQGFDDEQQVATSNNLSSADGIQDQFLLMLLTQLQHQDPLNPLDNTEFTNQLAQINTVQQLQNVNKNLNYEQLYLASINNSQSLGFMGKEIMASGNHIFYDGYNSAKINFDLPSDAARVVVNIFDSNNQLVHTIHAGEQSKGMNELTWQGVDNDGESVEEGTYRFEVMATDTNGNPINATTMLTGIVDGLSFEEGVTYVTVGGTRIPIGDIIEIGTAVTAAPVAAAADSGTDSETGSSETGIGDNIVESIKYIGALAVKAAPFLL